MILVSIIVPFYNSSKTIKSTLDSILKQTFVSFEVILINDGSEDNSLSIVENYISKDKRLKLYNQKNNGIVSARNLGIKKSIGRFIAFLDSDDIWDPNFLEESISIRYKSSHPIAITHCPYVRFKLYDKGIKYFVVKPPSVINHKNILKKNYIPLLSVLIDRSVVKELYFENIRPEDYKLWINLIYKYKHESISVDKILAFYRISNEQRSKNKFNSLVRIFKFYNKLPNQNLLKSLFKTFNWGFFNFLQRITFYGKIDPKKITYLLGLLN